MADEDVWCVAKVVLCKARQDMLPNHAITFDQVLQPHITYTQKAKTERAKDRDRDTGRQRDRDRETDRDRGKHTPTLRG
jgi:hypothetical protein